MSTTLQVVLTVNYSESEYAAHLGTVVDRDLPTRVASALTEALEETPVSVPRGTVLRVSDWWVSR